MSGRTKLGLGVLEAALLLGFLGDALLRATPWGLNVFLWIGVFVAGAHALARQKGPGRYLPGEGRWLWPVVLTYAAFFAWRDSLTLKFLDALAIISALSLAAYAARGGRVKLAGLTDYVLASAVAAANAVFGVFPLVFADVKWKEIPRTGWSKHALAAARGLLIALPLLLLFGTLFVAADAIYEGLVRDTFGFDAGLTFSHVLLFAFFAWVSGGYLRGMLLAERPVMSFAGKSVSDAPNTDAAPGGAQGAREQGAAPRDDDARGTSSGSGAYGTTEPLATPATGAGNHTTATAGYRFSSGEEEGTTAAREGFGRGPANDEANPFDGGENKESHKATVGTEPTKDEGATAAARTMREKVSLGIVEIGVVIGLLDMLFFSFVAVQLRYFFGDAQHVITSAGLTFSDYARRGFFELVWVALLALPLLLAAHWLLRKQKPTHERVFRGLAGAMIAMLFVIMASAVWRMHLYQSAYGQTELRFYTTAFMVWLGAVFVWFALTVLRGRRERFACGAFVAWLIVLAALHCINPGDLIVRANLAQARDTNRRERFDAHYAVSLGSDAVPALVEALAEMRPLQRGHVASALVQWRSVDEQSDWRSWNFSRARALRLIRENAEVLGEWDERRKSELKAEEEAAARARAASARQKVEEATALVPGTGMSIRVERRHLQSPPAWFLRAATLSAGDMVVATMQLPPDDGARPRIEVLKISDYVLALRDAHGVYVADLNRRILARQDDALARVSKPIPLGAFELDASGAWQFVPAPATAGPQSTRHGPGVSQGQAR